MGYKKMPKSARLVFESVPAMSSLQATKRSLLSTSGTNSWLGQQHGILAKGYTQPMTK